ncbi:hypothetical protein GH714_037215 [Hevea brasiliensis]|uniref:Trichome birefringence-like C-terminal domain-containing protein n=1 Tax=Hevea brasiliensis TaxID=3981 RepID=A0A6A6L6Q0_HEVBR|nr:hypothetical protein GH714_037215 [Hevea brasiliensis]
MYNEDVKSMAEFPFSWPKSQEIQEEPSIEANPVPETMKKDTEGIVSMNSRTLSLEEPHGHQDSDETAQESDDNSNSSNATNKEDEQKIELPLVEEDDEEVELPPEECDFSQGNGFNPRLLLNKLRNKRLLFVGDSLNRNQWESMICLVQSAVPSGRKTWRKEGSFAIFTMEDYNATIEFYWAPFLVESNSDDPNMHSILNRIIMPEAINKHGVNWKNVDYLIFNTYIWWMNTFSMKVLRGSFDEGATEYDEIERPVAYRRVLTTWSKWVDENVDPNRTMVFFSSMSPLHIKSLDWDNPDGIKCAKETTPILDTTRHLNVGTDRRLLVIGANLTQSMKIPVHFINITTLSEYRKDAHTSVYTIRQGKMLTPEQQADPTTYADCIHWCLPGLPDTWNEFIYTRIISHS